MAYKYYTVYNQNMAKTPKENYFEEMQANVNEVFYNSSDWYTIEEESSFGSEVYTELDVRINTVFDPTTGANQGDDWRKLIFKDIDKLVRVGQMYRFSNNYWIVINSDSVAGISNSCTIRRCNNTLRWITTSGAKYSVPCVLDYGVNENRDYASNTSKFVNPSGILEIITQLNTKTNQIKPSNRFLFGNSDNWTAYIVYGGGIHNFNNYTTLDGESGRLLKLTTGVNYVNYDIDDIVNGYANNKEFDYVITLDYSTLSASAGDSVQLVPSIFVNGETTEGVVEWYSSDETVCTVDSSGLVTMVADGSAVITAQLLDNVDVYATCSVSVTPTPTDGYNIDVYPGTNYVISGNATIYSVTLENNGSPQADVFTFDVLSGNVPEENYNLMVIDGNTFSVENIEMYLEESLVVRATSGIHTKDIPILLKGYW